MRRILSFRPGKEKHTRLKYTQGHMELMTGYFTLTLCVFFKLISSPSISSDPNDEMYWPLYTIPELEYKVMALNLTTDRALKADYCQFWNDVVPKIRTFTCK